MGIGSSLNCCKGTLRNTVILIDPEPEPPYDKNKNNQEDIKNYIINGRNQKIDTTSNNNTKDEYTFQAKSSVYSKSSVIVGEDNNCVNNEPFRPVNIPDKFPKESQYSFNEMFQKLD